MTTRDQVHKWFFYALGLLPVWVLERLCAQPGHPVWNHPPAAAPGGGVGGGVGGAYAGAGFGLAVGLLWELSYPGGFGGLVFGMTLAGMLTGAAAQYVLNQNLFSSLLCSGWC